MDFKKISQTAVEEVIKELKQTEDTAKIDEVVKIIDAVNMIAGVIEDTVKDMNLDEQGVKKVAKSSAKAAILEGLKTI